MATVALSVVMPVKDGARWLAAAVDSVLAQTFADFELLIVDDGSRDASREMAVQFARRDPRVEIIEAQSVGLVAALNQGIAAARAPLIARCDADDVLRVDRFAQQVTFLQQHPDVVLVGAWARTMDTHGRITGRMRRPTEHAALVRALGRDNPFIHSSVVFRTQTARQLGGYRAAAAAAEDYDLWMRMAEHGAVANLPEPLIDYRVHPDGVTRTESVRQAFSVRLVRRARAMRATSDADPMRDIPAPPDLFSSEVDGTFYEDDAMLCRFLALSDPALVTQDNVAKIPFPRIMREFSSLSRGERKLAQRAACNLLRADTINLPIAPVSLAKLIISLGPRRAVPLLLGALSHRLKPLGSPS